MTVPSQGFVLCRGIAGLDTEYFVVGPLAEGSWLRRVRVFWVAEATTRLAVGLALGAVNEASEIGFRGGVSLISSSNYRLHDKPAVALLVGGTLGGWYDVPVGVQITSGSRWLVGLANTNIAEADVSVVVAVECLQAGRGRGGGEDG